MSVPVLLATNMNFYLAQKKYKEKKIEIEKEPIVKILVEDVENVIIYLITSNITRTLGGRDRRSPLGKVRSLLSSNTEFKFSTHSGSTSPSNMIH